MVNESHLKFSADWLNRSGTFPLTIIFIHSRASIDDADIPGGPAKALVDIIKRHSSRCKSLHLDLHPSLMQSFCDPLSVDNLHVQSLHQNVSDFLQRTNPSQLDVFEPISVQLQHVKVRCENSHMFGSDTLV